MVEINGPRVLLHGILMILHKIITEPKIIIKQRLPRLQPNGLPIILNSLIKHTQILIVVSPVVIVQSIRRVELDGLGEVTHRRSEIPQRLVS